MLPDSDCSDPDCVQGRIGHCNNHNHSKPRKPTPHYGGRHRTPVLAGGGCATAIRQGAPDSMPGTYHLHTHNTPILSGRGSTTGMRQGVAGSMPGAYHPQTQSTPILSGAGYSTTSMHQGAPGSMVAPMARSYSSAAAPSVAEEAEGPGAGPLDDTEQDCAGAARRLTQVMNWMRDNGHTGAMLRDFAHSDSCNVPACSPFCRMFRRVRRHVQAAQHPCMLLRTYAVLLRLHVHSCMDEECGLRACPTLRNRHLVQNPSNEQQISTIQQEEDRSSDVDMPEH